VGRFTLIHVAAMLALPARAGDRDIEQVGGI